MNNLKKYNQKRNFNKTSEPIGKKEKSKKKLRFVVQHHLARKDHYDFRLEWNGTLKSWAVPKGPSYNPQDKRLAIQVEDHPLEYRNFEGVIPKGEYGGGTVMIFDEGYWEPLHESKENTLKFNLYGKRLKGKWTLIHFKDNNWLLIKEKDSIKGFNDINKFKTSIKTGKTMKEIENGNKKEDSCLKNIKISNPDKIIFKNPKVTKLDLVNYYKKVAKRMLPFLEKRIISTIRCPDGFKGEKFFKKHFENINQNLKMIKIKNKSAKDDDYYYITDICGLISEVQMNSYEFHTWGCNVDNLNHPNIMVFDLDPDENMNLKKVRQGVKDLKSILDEFSLTSFLKTSGGKGYHVVVPLNSIKTWKEFSKVAQNIAKLMETRWPDKYTSNIRKEKRKGKIFIDWLRNTKSSTSVAPYSVRLREKAYVSMPISWKELDFVKPNGITIKEALKKIKNKDPWQNFFDINQ